MTFDTLVSRGEEMHRELGREYYLTGAGLNAEPAFQAIYDRYPELTTDEALEVARAAHSAPLLEWLIGVRTGRAVAPLEERQLVWEREATVTVGDREIPYLRVPIELANCADRGVRTALDRARSVLAGRHLDALRRQRLATEHEVVRAAGYAEYVEAFRQLSGIDVDRLGAAAEAFLADTTDLYREGLARLVASRLGIGVDDLVRADAAWCFRADRFDDAFPSNRLLAVAHEQMAAMGLDAACAGRVRFDTDERPGKQPRAFCVPVRVPEEVYLVLRPRGGHADYRTFFHELGHAMHFATADPGLPFAARWLGDNSVTEGFAMLWDHLTLDPAWLARHTALEPEARRTLVFELVMNECYMVRRYAAKLRYELELHRSDFTDVGGRYAEHLTAATGFRYDPTDALLDVDPGFYAARYLRAWQLEAALATTLADRFGAEWYCDPAAGAVVADLMRRGQGDPADRIARDVTGAELAFDAVVRRLERLLATVPA